MPKSASTFLSRLLQNVDGMRPAPFVPAWDRREQELAAASMIAAVEETQNRRAKAIQTGGPWATGFVGQVHVRNSVPTQDIVDEFNLHVVVMVRNIYDIVMSLYDHFFDLGPRLPMAFVTPDIVARPKDEVLEFIVQMIIPWYFNFFAGWAESPHRFITYEQLTADPAATLRTIVDDTGYDFGTDKSQLVADAIERATGGFTRLNKGVAGRGKDLPPVAVERIREMAAWYPDTDFSSIGL